MQNPSHSKIGFRIAINFVLLILYLLIPIIASGDWQWRQGWFFFAVNAFFFILSRVIAIRADPGIIRERVTAASREDTKGWDKWLMPLIIILPGVVSLVAGLNHRFGWPPVVSAAWQVAGIMVYILVETFATWAMAVNAFFSSQVRIQTDRGHSVITGGPYRFVRHPAYAAGILAALASAPFLESWWALIPAVASIPFFILRTSLEDQTLQDELPGYREYAQKVRYRLLPGIW